MKTNSISYELGVLMAISKSSDDERITDSVKTIIKGLDDEEISDEFLLKGIRAELEDTYMQYGIDDAVEEILEEYELNIEINPMTDEDDKALEKFFENEDLFKPLPGMEYLDEEERECLSYNEKYFFEDYKLAKQIADNNRNLFIYTVVDGDNGTAWIINDWHFVNRQGYFFTTQKIDIPEEGVRYW